MTHVNSNAVYGGTSPVGSPYGRQSDVDRIDVHTSGYINVKSYGAAGDGVTDDTAAIQAAAAALTSGQTLTLPMGTYAVTSNIPINVAGVRLLGHGAKIVQSGAAQQGIAINAARVTIEGLWLYNSRGGSDWSGAGITNATGIRLNTGADYARIVGNRIEGWGCDGIRWNGDARGVLIEGNTIIGIGSAGGLTAGSNYNFGIDAQSAGTNSSGARIIGNIIRDAAQGIFIGNDWADLGIHGNVIEGIVGQHGMYVDNTVNLSITGNVISDVGQNGIKVQIASNATKDSNNVVISGNTVKGSGQVGIIVIPAQAGLSYFFHNVVIANNAIFTSGSEGIRIDQADGWLVSGNTVNGVATFGIRSDVRNRNGRIAGNTIYNTTQTALHVALASTSYVAIIEDNLIVEPSTAGGGSADLNSVMYLTTGEHIVRRNVVKSSATPYTNNITSHAASVVSLYENRLPTGKSNSLSGTVNAAFTGSVSADRGDNSVTIQAGVDAEMQRFATALTANRTVTLSTTSATKGDTFRVVRTGLGAFTLDVGGLKTIPSATAAFVDVAYNGSAWVLTGYGAL